MKPTPSPFSPNNRWLPAVYVAVCLMTLSGAVAAEVEEEEEEFNQPGTHTFEVPSGVDEITVELWGAGGAGGSAEPNNNNAGGGGGGAYGSFTLSVEPEETYDLFVGEGGESGENPVDGGDSWFEGPDTVTAGGGESVAEDVEDGGQGGAGPDPSGVDASFDGGDGGDEQGNDAGGGGSSAGPGGAGEDGGAPAGGTAPQGGGDGGDGATDRPQGGEDGVQPGGGGGGARSDNQDGADGGRGADGRVRISYEIEPAEAEQLSFSVQPSDTAIGAVIDPAVEVRLEDGDGNMVSESGVTVEIAIEDDGGADDPTLSGQTSVDTNADGIAVFNDLSIDELGDGYTLTATDPAGELDPDTSQPFDIVDPGDPEALAFSVQPTDAPAGGAIEPAVEVRIEDEDGNAVPDAAATVAIAIEDEPDDADDPDLAGQTEVDTVDGVAVFDDLAIDEVGEGYTLRAEDVDAVLDAAISDPFDITDAGDPAQLAFGVQPSNTTVDRTISPPVEVRIEDEDGNLVGDADDGVEIAIDNNPAGGTLSGTTTVDADGGVATFDDLSIDEVGDGYTLEAAAEDLDGAESVSFDIREEPEELPDCREAFGDDIALAVHEDEQGNLNLRQNSRVFNSTDVGANETGGSGLNQEDGAYCIADSDPTDPSPGDCQPVGAAVSWEGEGRDFPEPEFSDYPGTENLTVGDGETVTITTQAGDNTAYRDIDVDSGGHLIIEGDGEVTVRQSFDVEAGAELTFNGTPTLNVDGRIQFDDGGDRTQIEVNSTPGGTVDTFSRGNTELDNVDVDVTAGTLRPMATPGGGNINVADSDLNCDPTHEPGEQPANTMPECQNETGGVFIISRSSGGIEDSAVRAFVYIDGTQYNIDDSIVEGSVTAGGSTLRGSDFIPGPIPATGDFCEERVEGFAFDVGAGDASTCQRREVGITALDRFDQPLLTYDDTITLATSSNHGDWFRVDDDGETGEFDAVNSPFDTGNDDGFGRYEFDPDDLGQVSLFLENIHADDLRITAADTGREDEDIADTSDWIAFRDNVFLVDSVDDFDDDVIAGRDHLFEVTLWHRDGEIPDEDDQCVVPDSYDDEAQSVRLWHERDDDDPGGEAPGVTALGTDDELSTLPEEQPDATNIDLDFSDDPGRARFRLETSDVGKYGFVLAEQNSEFALDEEGEAREITGGSDDYVVRPFGFDVEVEDNPAAEDSDGDVFRDAGEAFEVTLRPVVYPDAADPDVDRFPGGYEGLGDDEYEDRIDLADADTTPAFGNEGSGDTTAFGATLAQPDDGREPGLDGIPDDLAERFTDDADSAAGEARLDDLYYDEVGIIVLNAEHENYLGSDRAVRGGSPGTVGRFIPAEFRLDGGSITDRSELGCSPESNFTYMGERFEVDFDLQAYSRRDNVVENYDTALGFALHDPGDEDELNMAAYPDGEGDPIDHLAVEDPGGSWESGQADVTVGLIVERACEDGDCPRDPYADLAIGTAPEDEDGVEFGAFDLPDNESGEHGEVASTEVVFGRLALDDVQGSGNDKLEMDLRAEYYDGDRFVTHEADSCTEIDLADEVLLTGSGQDDDPVSGTEDVPLNDNVTTNVDEHTELDDNMLALEEGEAAFVFDPPGTDVGEAWVELELNIGEDDSWPYLRDDLGDDDEEPPFKNNPVGKVEFNIDPGARHPIFSQEVFQ